MISTRTGHLTWHLSLSDLNWLYFWTARNSEQLPEHQHQDSCCCPMVCCMNYMMLLECWFAANIRISRKKKGGVCQSEGWQKCDDAIKLLHVIKGHNDMKLKSPHRQFRAHRKMTPAHGRLTKWSWADFSLLFKLLQTRIREQRAEYHLLLLKS